MGLVYDFVQPGQGQGYVFEVEVFDFTVAVPFVLFVSTRTPLRIWMLLDVRGWNVLVDDSGMAEAKVVVVPEMDRDRLRAFLGVAIDGAYELCEELDEGLEK